MPLRKHLSDNENNSGNRSSRVTSLMAMSRATVITVARTCLSSISSPPNRNVWSDQDYETAEVIGNKLLLHMAAAYRMIDGESQELVPEIKPLDQRRVLFEQLPEEYPLSQLIAEASSQGISRRSAIRWNDIWQEDGLVKKVNHGNYKKIA